MLMTQAEISPSSLLEINTKYIALNSQAASPSGLPAPAFPALFGINMAPEVTNL